MTEPPIAPERPDQPDPYTLANVLPVSKPPAPRWIFPAVVFVAIMAAGLAAVLLVPKLLRPAAPAPAAATHSTAASTAPAPAGGTFTATGGIQLINKAAHWKLGDPCEGTGGFQDIRSGADVLVSGPQGEDLALGQLSGGVAFEADDLSTFCQFIFTVSRIPAGKGIYTLTIGHRPKKFTEAELREDISLSLGGD